jgi:hypothetical protein
MRLLHKRSILQQNQSTNSIDTVEGYQNYNVNGLSSNNSCPITIKNNITARLTTIQTLGSTNRSKSTALYNFAIKSSMNTSYDGKECTTDMINYVLSRGCRFLDLAIFRDPTSGASIVSVSTSSDFTIPIIQEKPLFLSDAINYISMYGFNSTCPNQSDPLFIQFRPRDPSTDIDYANLMTIYNDIYSTCTTYLPSFLLRNQKIKPTTSITNLLGKVIIIMDITLYNYATILPQYSTDPSILSNLTSLVNMDNNIYDASGGTVTFSYSNLPAQKPLTLSSDKFSCAVNNTITQNLWIDQNNNDYNTNADSYNLFKNYSCQLVPMLFYNNGTDLYNYEMLFNTCGGGIVPLSVIYSKVSVSSTPYIAYPSPAFAIPNYGNTTVSVIIITACLGITGYIVYSEFR